MSSSKNMDFPVTNKSSYTSKVENSKNLIENPNFLAVPGPQGLQGKQGIQGPQGLPGKDGKDGIKGPKGDRGLPGKDGKSYITVYDQDPGWASYESLEPVEIKSGSNKGVDGWVSLFISKKNVSEERYLPKGSVSLYNPETKSINLKGLKLGSQVNITYEFAISTIHANTEVWIRSYFINSEREVTSFAASLKYQHEYLISETHSIFLKEDSDKRSGIIPQVRTDLDAFIKLKSIHISVH